MQNNPWPSVRRRIAWRRLPGAVLRALTFALALAVGPPAPGYAQEVIRHFDAQVGIRADRTLEVTETIRVRAEGDQIRHGIYRDFPTTYTSWRGRARVPFELVSVTRDGIDEPWQIKPRENGVRVYVGDPVKDVPAGEHEYVLRYRTDWQLGFFPDHDELYWNVTGNGWSFPIMEATAAITLPDPLPAGDLKVDAYSGPAGAQGRQWVSRIENGGRVRFASTAALQPGEGLSVVVRWPKGLIAEPTDAERFARWQRDNLEWQVAAGGLVLLLAYYLIVWYRYGRDPAGETVIPRFAPPKGLSAADARYLERRGYDDRVFTAGILALAVKGCLTLRKEEDAYVLSSPAEGDRRPLAKDERALLDALQLTRGKALRVGTQHVPVVQQARDALKKELRKEHFLQHFVTNSLYLIPGLLLSLACLVLAVFRGGQLEPVALFMLVWLTGWSFGVFVLLRITGGLWLSVFAGELKSIIGALFMTAFSIPFAGGELVGLYALSQASIIVAVALFIMIGVNFLFYRLLQAPTLAGRKFLDELAGFRMYLVTAEKDEMRVRTGPQRTLELFEKYLPYAIALDVETQWSARFTDLLTGAAAEGTQASPHWYGGAHWSDFSDSGFAGALGDGLTGAVSSSSTPPGSSSGDGGGGSSGGGGGGGGGGW